MGKEDVEVGQLCHPSPAEIYARRVPTGLSGVPVRQERGPGLPVHSGRTCGLFPPSAPRAPAHMIPAIGYAAKHSWSKLRPLAFERREPGPRDVQIEVLYCGVCHSDLHQVQNDWDNTVYPCLPGHEIVGRVAAVGAEVTGHAVGDRVGVGCMVDSCRTCPACEDGLEQYCEGPKGWTATYNGPLKPDGTNTYGGYSDSVVVDEHFVLKIPAGMDLQTAAPLLCAGVTTYSPLKHWNVGPGTEVGVVGIGGLGHVAVRIAKALGARVTAFTTHEDKVDEIRTLGADDVVLSTDKAAMAAQEGALDVILDTVPEPHDFNPYVTALARDGHLVVCGLLAPNKLTLEMMEVLSKRRSIAGTIIGGIAETQETLDFCAEHGVAADVQVIPIQDVNTAFKTLDEGDVRFRFVIDMASLREEAARKEEATAEA